LAVIFNEIKSHVNTSLGLVGKDASPPMSAPARDKTRDGDQVSSFHHYQLFSIIG